MCLVEVGETKPDGTVAMGPKLVPGCQTPIKEGTVIRTDSAKVKTSQQMTLELLLLNHPLIARSAIKQGVLPAGLHLQIWQGSKSAR
jgi:predicted molibdopterin-dependent oxidoreductase YjgC